MPTKKKKTTKPKTSQKMKALMSAADDLSNVLEFGDNPIPTEGRTEAELIEDLKDAAGELEPKDDIALATRNTLIDIGAIESDLQKLTASTKTKKKAAKAPAKADKKAAPKTKEKTTALAKKPVEILTKQEAKMLDGAVEFINERMYSISENMIEIGAFLLENFFDGDIKKVKDHAPKKGISLRKLADHPDIDISYSGLSRAISLAVQEKRLGAVATPQQLTPSHKVLLLNVDNVDEKKKLAKEVKQKKLSVRQFKEVLKKEGHTKPRGRTAGKTKAAPKQVPSSLQFYLDPFEAIIKIKFDEAATEMTIPNIKKLIKTIEKAQQHSHDLIHALEKIIKQKIK